MVEPDTLLATKLYVPPPRHNLVPRPRLVARLDAGLRGPLTLVVAPAGYGKTTLLAEWRAVQQGDRDTPWPCAWLSLDAEDNDLARFLRYLVAALQTLHPALGHAMLAGLRAPQPPPGEALVTLLLNELMALPEDVILVLDDYHVIDAAPVHQALAFLLDHLPPRVHLVLSTRVEPPLPLARLRARARLVELRAADLRFSADDAAAFLQQALGLPLATEDVAWLEARTEGWIAGLHLAALALQGHDPAHISDAIAALTGTHRYIFDYLADEVYARQPAAVQRFLLRTSVLDRLSGPLCAAVTAGVPFDGSPGAASDVGNAGDAGDGQAMLERLEAANLFIVPLDDERTWFRYHHLFAGFLRARLRREQPELLPDLHRRAAHWLAQQGLAEQAAEQALAAGDAAQAAQLIEQVSGALLWQRAELATLRRWRERLSREVTRSRPRLSLDLAWALLWGGQADAVEPRLQDAEDGLDGAVPAAGDVGLAAEREMRGEIAALRAELARQRSDLAAAIALAQQALAHLPMGAHQVRGVTLGLLGGTYLSRGDAAGASRAYEDALAASQTGGAMTLALFAGGRLAQARALHGRLHQAAATYRQALQLADSHGLAATPAIGVAQVAMGEVLREWNDLDAADDLVRQGIARCADVGGLAEVALDGWLTLARVRQARGDTAGAHGALDRAERLGQAGHVPQAADRVAAARARLWLTATPGDRAATLRWAAARRAVALADGQSSYPDLLARLTLARVRLMEGALEDAATLLQELLGQAEAGGLTGSVLEVLVLQARVFLAQGQMANAMIALSRSLVRAEPEGYIHVFLDEGAALIPLLQQAQARGVAPTYVAALLAACSSSPRATSPAAPLLVAPLSAREVEVVRLLAAGLSTPEIAAQLFVTGGTVRSHLKQVYAKLDVHSRLHAVDRARSLGLI